MNTPFIDSASLQPFVDVYIENLFNVDRLIKDGKMTESFKSFIDTFVQETTDYDTPSRTFLRVPPALLVENSVVVKMDLGNQFTCNFAIRLLDDQIKWWYFIVYYGRAVVINAGYRSPKRQVTSRSFLGLVKSIRPNFSNNNSLVTSIQFELYDLLVQGLQQTTTCTFPSEVVNNDTVIAAIQSFIYNNKFSSPNIFKETFPMIWAQKFNSMKDRAALRLNTNFDIRDQKNRRWLLDEYNRASKDVRKYLVDPDLSNSNNQGLLCNLLDLVTVK